MTTNLSKLKRDKLLSYIEKMKALNKDNIDNFNILLDIENALTEKKYGLVFEKHQERVDLELEGSIPVFIENRDKEIIYNRNQHSNFLLEGDNLHSLYLLEKTHKNLIDYIYIDPPYNRGKNDFIYDDDCVGEEDGFRHSKWLSFMENRLKIARNLLKEEGLIVISIDDNEQANLKLLCDSTFGESNFICNLPTIMNLKGNQDEFGFAGTHEYTLVYAKDKSVCKINQFNVDEEEVEKSWKMDELGYYKEGANLKATGVNAPREKRPNLYFPIYISGEKLFLDKPNEIAEEVYPITNGKEMSWRWSKQKFLNEQHNIIIKKKNNNISIYKKQRPELSDLPTKKAKSFLYKPEYSSGNGTEELKNILGEKLFNNPKPKKLIKDLIYLCTKKDSIVLDFFAGSGTTGQAVLELNKEDGGERNFILCTNNQNKICEDITYQRLYKIINGYEDLKGNKIEGINANLKYYRTDYIKRFSEDEYSDIDEELKPYLESLVQLENMIDINSNNIMLILTQEEADELLTQENLKGIKKLYMATDILTSLEQENLIKSMEVIEIPEYYFKDELWESELCLA